MEKTVSLEFSSTVLFTLSLYHTVKLTHKITCFCIPYSALAIRISTTHNVVSIKCDDTISNKRTEHFLRILSNNTRNSYTLHLLYTVSLKKRATNIKINQSSDSTVFFWLIHISLLPSVHWRCWSGCRKGIRSVKNWVVGCWHGYLSGARCRLAYGPADATASHCLLLQQNPVWFYLSSTGSPG